MTLTVYPIWHFCASSMIVHALTENDTLFENDTIGREMHPGGVVLVQRNRAQQRKRARKTTRHPFPSTQHGSPGKAPPVSGVRNKNNGPPQLGQACDSRDSLSVSLSQLKQSGARAAKRGENLTVHRRHGAHARSIWARARGGERAVSFAYGQHTKSEKWHRGHIRKMPIQNCSLYISELS